MPRHSQGNSGGPAVITTILNSITSKEKQYKDGINQNQGFCNATAERLAIEGDIEKCLLLAIKGSEKDGEQEIIPEAEIRAFMEEQRQRLKKLAEGNGQRERDIDSFLGAIGSLKQQVAAENAQEGRNNYQERIKQLMENHANNGMHVDVKNSKFVKELRDKLGEKDTSANRNRNDDDIEVVRNNKGGSVNLKCPILLVLMDDAVKNKRCGHVYSRKGIQSLFNKNGVCECPVPGCHNKQFTADQLEECHEIIQLVKRQKRREAAEQSQRMQSQVDSDFEEETEL